MTLLGAVRWSLRPKRVAVLLAKLILMGATDLAAQTGAWQNINGGTEFAVVRLQTNPRPYRSPSACRSESVRSRTSGEGE